MAKFPCIFFAATCIFDDNLKQKHCTETSQIKRLKPQCSTTSCQKINFVIIKLHLIAHNLLCTLPTATSIIFLQQTFVRSPTDAHLIWKQSRLSALKWTPGPDKRRFSEYPLVPISCTLFYHMIFDLSLKVRRKWTDKLQSINLYVTSQIDIQLQNTHNNTFDKRYICFVLFSSRK